MCRRSPNKTYYGHVLNIVDAKLLSTYDIVFTIIYWSNYSLQLRFTSDIHSRVSRGGVRGIYFFLRLRKKKGCADLAPEFDLWHCPHVVFWQDPSAHQSICSLAMHIALSVQAV